MVLKKCAQFTDCMNEINNTQIDNTKEIDVTMPMYNLIEYSNNYSKTSGRLRQYYWDKSPSTNAGISVNFHANNSASFKFKEKNSFNRRWGKKTVKIMIPMK